MKIKGRKRDKPAKTNPLGVSEQVTEDYFDESYSPKSDKPKADEIDIDFGNMTFEDATEKASSGNNTPIEAQEVEDEDLGDVATSDELYHIKEEQKKVDNQVLDAVDSSMSEIKTSMSDVILKQAQVLEKNADSMQSMQENLTTVVKSQSEMVSSISKAIDKRLSQQDAYVSGLVEDRISNAVDNSVAQVINEDLKGVKKSRFFKKVMERLKSILLCGIVLFILYCLISNSHIRARIGLVFTDLKNGIVETLTDGEVTSNKTIKDLGVNLHKINTTYYDETGKEISEEEYLKRVNEGSTETFDINE